MRERQSGLNLLRCMALFFVNGVHSFLYNGFYSEPQIGVTMWFGDCLRWLCFSCVGLFLILTGYLKSQKPLNKNYFKSLIPVLLGYVLTCAISFPIRHFLLGDQLSFHGWMEKLFTFGNYGWYVEMYIGLLLISPVINLALERLRSTKALVGAALVAFCITALPSISKDNWIPNYWTALYPLTYYVIGAVIRRLQPRLKLWLGTACILLWAGIMGLISLTSTDQGFSKGFTQGYGGFWATILVTLLFLTFYAIRLGPKAAKVAAWMASGVFEGYLLSRLLDVWVYDLVRPWHDPKYYALILLCVTVPVFLVSVLMGKATHTLVEWLWARVPKGPRKA